MFLVGLSLSPRYSEVYFTTTNTDSSRLDAMSLSGLPSQMNCSIILLCNSGDRGFFPLPIAYSVMPSSLTA